MQKEKAYCLGFQFKWTVVPRHLQLGNNLEFNKFSISTVFRILCSCNGCQIHVSTRILRVLRSVISFCPFKGETPTKHWTEQEVSEWMSNLGTSPVWKNYAKIILQSSNSQKIFLVFFYFNVEHIDGSTILNLEFDDFISECGFEKVHVRTIFKTLHGKTGPQQKTVSPNNSKSKTLNSDKILALFLHNF